MSSELEEQLDQIRLHADALERVVDAIDQQHMRDPSFELTPDQYNRFVQFMGPAQSAYSIGAHLLYRDLQRTHEREDKEASGANY